MKVRDESLIDNYFELLKFSFELINKDSEYKKYSYYIWDIVLNI